MYSGCSRKNLVMMVMDTVFSACSLVGSRTSQVAKLRLQKYWHGTSAFLRRSSNPSFFSPTSPTKDTVLGSSFSMISGMGKISLSLKYWAYLPTRSFSWSPGPFCWTFQDAGLGGFPPCPGWIGLSVSEGTGREGQLDPMRLEACVSGSKFFRLLREGFFCYFLCSWWRWLIRMTWKVWWLRRWLRRRWLRRITLHDCKIAIRRVIRSIRMIKGNNNSK